MGPIAIRSASLEAQIASCGVLERHAWTAADTPAGDLAPWADQHEYTPLWQRRRLVGVPLSELLDAVVDTIELLPGEAPATALTALAPLDEGMVSRAHKRGVALRYGLPGDIQGRLFKVALALLTCPQRPGASGRDARAHGDEGPSGVSDRFFAALIRDGPTELPTAGAVPTPGTGDVASAVTRPEGVAPRGTGPRARRPLAHGVLPQRRHR